MPNVFHGITSPVKPQIRLPRISSLIPSPHLGAFGVAHQISGPYPRSYAPNQVQPLNCLYRVANL